MTLLYRLISGVAIAGAWALGMLYLPGWALFLIFLVCALLCQWEFYKLVARGGYAVLPGRGLVLGACWLGAVFSVPQAMDVFGYIGAFLLVGGGLLLFLHLLFDPHSARPLESAAMTLLGFFYVPFLLSYYIRLAQWEAPGYFNLSRGGIFLAFYVALVVKLADVGAYAAGRLWGRHKLLPRISPGKSWEGLAGGVALAVAASVAMVALSQRWHVIPRTPLSDLHLWTAAALGLLLAAIGVLGDLVESMFKRNVQAKDSSALVPGMGGWLDVFDSLVFAPAVFYLLLPWLRP
jgi:phosphatidate cytidylyltransferase